VPRADPVPDEVRAIADARLARVAEELAEADRLRGELHAAGWEWKTGPTLHAARRPDPDVAAARWTVCSHHGETRDEAATSRTAPATAAGLVSRDLAHCVAVPEIARTLQGALDDWSEVVPALGAIAAELNAGRLVDAMPFDPRATMAPLPRAYQWADGSAYVNHVELVRRARGVTMPPEFWIDPLMYQGASDHMLGACEDIVLADETWGIDFEAEVAVITGDVPMGTAPPAAGSCIRLLMLVNDEPAQPDPGRAARVPASSVEAGQRLLAV
jgi:hypothetical protein